MAKTSQLVSIRLIGVSTTTIASTASILSINAVSAFTQGNCLVNDGESPTSVGICEASTVSGGNFYAGLTFPFGACADHPPSLKIGAIVRSGRIPVDISVSLSGPTFGYQNFEVVGLQHQDKSFGGLGHGYSFVGQGLHGAA